MEYYVYDENFDFNGVTETLPEDRSYTEVPYLETFLIPKFDPKSELWYESASMNDVSENEQSKIHELTVFYTEKIDALIKVPIQKFIMDGTPIPLYIKIERDNLKKEYNDLTSQVLKK